MIQTNKRTRPTAKRPLVAAAKAAAMTAAPATVVMKRHCSSRRVAHHLVCMLFRCAHTGAIVNHAVANTELQVTHGRRPPARQLPLAADAPRLAPFNLVAGFLSYGCHMVTTRFASSATVRASRRQPLFCF